MKKKIFLLGGHDLEMLEIATLLKEAQVEYADRNLRWDNALLAAYAQELQQYGNQPDWEIYGVELRGEGVEEKYNNYVLVDHHNDYSDRPSSLQQVAVLIGTELSRQQCLIAANDAAYIPGMQALGATAEEIGEIRRKDRAFQGITEAEETLAEKAIRENRKQVGDLIVIRALTSAFSPVCDRLWPYRKLLIYTDKELCYYGEGKEKLVKEFYPEIVRGKMYHGGGENGFLGTADGSYMSGEIVALAGKIEQDIARK